MVSSNIAEFGNVEMFLQCENVVADFPRNVLVQHWEILLLEITLEQYPIYIFSNNLVSQAFCLKNVALVLKYNSQKTCVLNKISLAIVTVVSVLYRNFIFLHGFRKI